VSAILNIPRTIPLRYNIIQLNKHCDKICGAAVSIRQCHEAQQVEAILLGLSLVHFTQTTTLQPVNTQRSH